MRRHSKDIPNREIGGFAILCGSQEFLQQMAGQCSLLKDCEFEVTNFWPSVGEKSEIFLRKLFVKTHWRVLIRWFYCCKKFQQNALNQSQSTQLTGSFNQKSEKSKFWRSNRELFQLAIWLCNEFSFFVQNRMIFSVLLLSLEIAHCSYFPF